MILTRGSSLRRPIDGEMRLSLLPQVQLNQISYQKCYLWRDKNSHQLFSVIQGPSSIQHLSQWE